MRALVKSAQQETKSQWPATRENILTLMGRPVSGAKLATSVQLLVMLSRPVGMDSGLLREPPSVTTAPGVSSVPIRTRDQLPVPLDTMQTV